MTVNVDHYTRMVNTFKALGTEGAAATLSLINTRIDAMNAKLDDEQPIIRIQGYTQTPAAISELMELQALGDEEELQ